MLRGDSRQLLILGVPTITLVFGLLFLRHRRRKRGTLHTDPGGTTDNTLNQKDFLVEPSEISLNVDKKLLDSDNSFREAAEDFKPAVEDSLKKAVELLSSSPSSVQEEECVKDEPVPEQNVVDQLTSEIEERREVEQIIQDFVDLTLDCSLESTPQTENCRKIEIESVESFAKTEEADLEFVDLIEDCSHSSLTTSSDKEEGELTSSTIVEECSDSQIGEECNATGVISLPQENVCCSSQPEIDIKPSLVNSREEGELLDSSVEEVQAEIESAPEKVEPEPVTSSTEETEKMKKNETGELVDKLVNLELDSMNISSENAVRKESTERDSANHSPSEVMLASPSISNFSDAHSEGSSDSGKGHSDVATSPSRTPAGGSSLAGDLALSLYEFVLPQNIVGRLIGRHGASLHEIRSSTGTNIFIKRHPETNKLKICAIEGTQQDIDKALAKIRQKFPLRRFPHLTLEKVSFVSLNSVPPLKLEDFHLQLVEGVNNDVILSSLISAAHFFLQQPSHPSYASLSALNTVMNSVYSSPEAPVLDPPIKDAVCAAPTMGGWYRAQVLSVDEENGTSYVRFLDYGGYLVLQSSCLKQIRGDLLTLPFQAVECYLANVAPAAGEFWTEEARLYVQSLTQGQLLQAQIYDYAEDGTPLVYLYTSYDNEVILINEELVVRGYAVLTTSPTASGGEEE